MDDRPRVDHDKPPFSRLFVVCSRDHTDSDIRDAFSEYGEVEDVWVVKNKITKENKGIAYVKFEKASEAARAMEKLHGTTIGDNPKPIKALLADAKTSSRDKVDPVTQLTMNDDKHRTRIFILVPKSLTDSELQDEFSQFGKVDHVQILKDKVTSESKGCAYVRFARPSEAFNAIENCDKSYKAIIAEPRVPKNLMTSTPDHPVAAVSQVICPIPQGFPDMTEQGASNKLTISCHTSLTEVQLTRLFDICPGLASFELSVSRYGESKGLAAAVYGTSSCASYAKQKLNNIEFPPGYRLSVNYKQEQRMGGFQSQNMGAGMVHEGYQGYSSFGYDNSSVQGGMQGGMQGGVQGMTGSNVGGYDYSGYQNQAPVSSCPYTDVALPGHQPISNTTHCRAKLFFVAAPVPIGEEVLSDVFCRFSDLIDIQIIPGTAYGYIRYAMKESADAAKMLLDGATVGGSTLRLSFAEPAGDNKRAKIDH